MSGVGGTLVDKAMMEAGIMTYYRGYTNAIACTPYDSPKRDFIRQPAKDEIKACSPRLRDLINSSSPRKIIALGDKAKQALTLLKVDFVALAHPMAIIRKGGEGSVDYKRLVLQLKKIKEELGL